MAGEQELAALLAQAAAAIDPPAGGPERILALASPPTSAVGVIRRVDGQTRAPRSAHRRLLLAGGLSIAAAGLVAGLVVTSGDSAPTPAATPLGSERGAAGAPVGGFGSAHGKAAASNSSASSVTPPAAAPAAPQDLEAAPSLPDGSRPAALTPGTTAAAPQIVTTGSVVLGVRRAALAGDVTRLGTVAAAAQGFVSASDVSESGQHPGGSVTLRAPAARFDRLVRGTQALGTVRSLRTSSNDVSAQVVDLAARIGALQDARSQLEALLRRAGKISDLLSVEAEIEATQSQIEQLQGAQRLLLHEVDDSTLVVQLQVVNPPRPAPHHRPGGLDAAWHHAVSGFVGGLRATIADLGVVLFAVLGLAVLATLVVALGRVAWRLLVRRLA